MLCNNKIELNVNSVSLQCPKQRRTNCIVWASQINFPGLPDFTYLCVVFRLKRVFTMKKQQNSSFCIFINVMCEFGPPKLKIMQKKNFFASKFKKKSTNSIIVAKHIFTE